MDRARKRELNLVVLKRHDPSIDSIIDGTSHVVVYDFDTATQSWTKRGVEGAMFIFSRGDDGVGTGKGYGFFVLNRLGVDNFKVVLTGDMEFQLMADYVIYRQPDDSIIGLWMYEEHDRGRLAQILESLARTPSPASNDILSLFKRAKRASHVPAPSTAPSTSLGTEQHNQYYQPQPSHQRQLQHYSVTSSPPPIPSATSNINCTEQEPPHVLLSSLLLNRGGQSQNLSSPAPLLPTQNPALAILAAIQGSPSPALQHQPPPPPLRVHHPNGFPQQQPYPQQQQHAHQYYAADVHPFRPILQLSDLWQWIDHVPNGVENNNMGQQSQEELRARLQWLLQNDHFVDALYVSYMSFFPTHV
ncbi:hypothetical protein BJ742DRAFT_829293, partial [Cladochytrium replicatum]